MNDNEIIELYFARAENAITETDKKYGPYCRTVSRNILGSPEDSEECVNDTYLKLWNAIPPARPLKLAVYIASVVRSIALNMRRSMTAKKRGGGSCDIAYEEISECLPAAGTVESEVDGHQLVTALNDFLASLGSEKQKIFMMRYYHFLSISEIAGNMNISEEKVKTTLYRTREKLRKYLEKEGIDV